MQIPAKRLQNGFELPVYGLGLWSMGGRLEADTTNDLAEIKAIQTALKLGITHFDVAESYGAGHSEELLGQAIQGVDRHKLIIASKVSDINLSYDNILSSCEASLKRLKTNYLDLYMLHRFPLPNMAIHDTMRAMDQLITQGLAKHIGVCNITPHRFAVAQNASTHKLVCNQVHYNVQYREIETKGVLQHCQDNDVMLVAWRPLQKGSLPASSLIDSLARKYDKTPHQIALNWLISQQNVVTIAKTSKPEHLMENLGALGWTMEAGDIELIRREFPDQKLISDAVPLDYPASEEP